MFPLSFICTLLVSIHAFLLTQTHKGVWMLEALPSLQLPLKVSLSQGSPYSLPPALYPVLTYIWQRRGNVKMAWLPAHSHPPFSFKVSPFLLLVFSYSLLHLVVLHTLTYSWILKRKKAHFEWKLGCSTHFFCSCSGLEGLPTSSVGSVILMPTCLVERSRCLR